jgi:hypothetical protein
MHQVIANQLAWRSLADPKDLVQHPAAARTVRLQSLAARTWITAASKA